MKKTFTILVFCALLGGLLAGCSGTPFEGTAEPTSIPPVVSSGEITAEARLVPAQYTQLYFASSGNLESIAVAEGDEVRAGAVLASIGGREAAEAQLAAAQLEQLNAQQALDQLNRTVALAQGEAAQALADASLAVAQTQQEYDRINTDDLRVDIDDKQAQVNDAFDTLEEKLNDLAKYNDLDPDNATRRTAQQAVETARNDYDRLRMELAQMQYALDSAQAARDQAIGQQVAAQYAVDQRADGPDADALALAQATLEQADAHVAAAERALADTDLRAPYDGTVVDLHHLSVGSRVGPGGTSVVFADLSQWYLETTDLTESDVVNLSEGQAVTAYADAFPDVELSGVVESIGRGYSEVSGDIMYTVRIRLDDPGDLNLRWGMTVQVTFLVE